MSQSYVEDSPCLKSYFLYNPYATSSTFYFFLIFYIGIIFFIFCIFFIEYLHILYPNKFKSPSVESLLPYHSVLG